MQAAGDLLPIELGHPDAAHEGTTMRHVFHIASMSIVAVAGVVSAQPAAAPRVRVDTGMLEGRDADGVIAFKGIPFAAPPVGPLRWRAPQPAMPWEGVRDAGHYGHDCMQKPFDSDAAPLGTQPAEDCLYANVWRPTGGGRALPVMVWIYGGGFVNGGASPPTYAGTELARQGIMVVSFNYRLGRFGTFVHPGLTRADADQGLLANYGYMDQIAALRWVQRNIAAFGGDPGNVTIVGESAGGISVHALVTSPMARGLFRRAVIQSGGPIAMGDATLAAAQAASLGFARGQGIDDADPAALAKLRALPPERVVDGLNLATMTPPPGTARTYSSPVLDGRITVDAPAAYAAGHFARVPVMIGATSDDIGGPAGPMAVGAQRIAGILAAQDVPVYAYRFSYVASAVRDPSTRGAGHATDIPFFFDTAAIKYGAATTPADRAAATLASGYLVRFVKTGDPNGPGLPHWPRFTTRDRSTVDLDATGHATVIAAP